MLSTMLPCCLTNGNTHDVVLPHPRYRVVDYVDDVRCTTSSSTEIIIFVILSIHHSNVDDITDLNDRRLLSPLNISNQIQHRYISLSMLSFRWCFSMRGESFCCRFSSTEYTYKGASCYSVRTVLFGCYIHWHCDVVAMTPAPSWCIVHNPRSIIQHVVRWWR